MSTDVIASYRELRRAISRAAASIFSATGVGPKQVVILREMRSAGSVSQVALARATLTDPAAMMRALDALERRGWVFRVSSDDDRRRKLVSLTATGRHALEELDVSYESLRSAASSALSASEREQFCALADRIASTLNRVTAPALEQA
jgi:DNA-binding MarR family transcriptional regulator